jgi:hypothetical protein
MAMAPCWVVSDGALVLLTPGRVKGFRGRPAGRGAGHPELQTPASKVPNTEEKPRIDTPPSKTNHQHYVIGLILAPVFQTNSPMPAKQARD